MVIACVVGEGFEESEFEVPVQKLKAAGHEVKFVGAEAGVLVAGKRGQVQVKTDVAIEDAQADDYDALLIPGGQSPDHLRIDERFVDFVADFDDDDKPIFAICHGPQLLLTADLVDGRRLTAWPTVQVDLEYAGADVVDEEVVVDDNWVTSRKPEDLDAFCREALAMLESIADEDVDEDEEQAPVGR